MQWDPLLSQNVLPINVGGYGEGIIKEDITEPERQHNGAPHTAYALDYIHRE